jgi:WhiB family redox-sensing transcriptional regulator
VGLPPLEEIVVTLTVAVRSEGAPRGATLGVDTDWTAGAICASFDPDELFVTGAAQQHVKRLCSGCPVKLQCLADALDNRVDIGVWGGMTERERRALVRRHPDVRDWGAFLRSTLPSRCAG